MIVGYANYSYRRRKDKENKHGAKYLFMLLVVDLGLIILGNALSTDANIKDLAMTLFAVIVIKEIAEGVDGFVDGIFSGMGSSGGSVISGYMQRSASTVQQATVGAAAGMARGAAGGGFAAAKAAAAAGEGGGKMANIGRAADAGLAGSIGGAITGAAKGAMGKANKGTGQLSGIASVKAVTTLVNVVSSISGKVAEAVTGNNPVSSTKSSNVSDAGSASTKDRTGFDTSLINKDSSSGEIKPS